MKIGAAFPSKYLKASDLNEKPWVLTMDRLEIEGVGANKDQRPVVYFLKTEKGLVLNKTNSNIIAKTYGEETDQWMGNQIELYPTMVDFQGDQVEAIRVRAPKRNAGAAAQPPARPVAPPQQHDTDRNGHDLDDEIPF